MWFLYRSLSPAPDIRTLVHVLMFSHTMFLVKSFILATKVFLQPSLRILNHLDFLRLFLTLIDWQPRKTRLMPSNELILGVWLPCPLVRRLWAVNWSTRSNANLMGILNDIRPAGVLWVTHKLKVWTIMKPSLLLPRWSQFILSWLLLPLKLGYSPDGCSRCFSPQWSFWESIYEITPGILSWSLG